MKTCDEKKMESHIKMVPIFCKKCCSDKSIVILSVVYLKKGTKSTVEILQKIEVDL